MTDAVTTQATTILGADASFKGELTFDGAMRIDGKFEGKLNTKGRLSIGRGAKVSAEMTVGTVTIEGAFRGNVIASERIELAATARVQGDLKGPRLVVAEGATLEGTLHITPDGAKTVPAGTKTEEVTAARH